MQKIRRATRKDLSRIAEILVFNNRLNFFPIFGDERYSFGEMQVLPLADRFFGQPETLKELYVYDDGVIRGFTQIHGREIVRLFVEPLFQSRGYGAALIEYAITEHHAEFLWALEKNTRAIAFYARHGFYPSGERKLEEDTTEYLIKLKKGED